MKRKIVLFFLVFLSYCIFWYQRSKYRQPIVMYSERVTNIVGIIMWFDTWVVKWIALPPPFVLLRKKWFAMEESRIRHEQTHHLQMSESLLLFNVFSHLEKIFARHILWKNNMDAYLWKATEQEAYLNQHNPIYNKERQLRSTRTYFKNKQKFRLDQYQLICSE